jgi:hypothetical protein
MSAHRGPAGRHRAGYRVHRGGRSAGSRVGLRDTVEHTGLDGAHADVESPADHTGLNPDPDRDTIGNVQRDN